MNDIYESDIFKATRHVAKSQMESIILEGVMSPSREQWQRNAAPAKATAAARKDTGTWLERLIRSEYRRESELDGAWSIINGQDALIGGWTVGERLIQVIVTRSRVHVRTKLPTAKSKASDAEKITAAVALGRELFGLGSESAELAKTARRLGDFAYAAPQPKDQKGFRTCYLIVTDGVSVKYSFVKLNGDPAEIKGDRPFAPPRPWFGERPRPGL
jgi:hypothetical protein